MPNVKHRMLTHVKVNSLAKPGTYSDGGGLTLRVSNSGRKHWVHRVTIDGTPRVNGAEIVGHWGGEIVYH